MAGALQTAFDTTSAREILSLPELERAAFLNWLADAEVRDSEQANLVSAWRQELRVFIETDEEFTALESKIHAADQAHKELTGRRTVLLRPFKRFIDAIDLKLKTWLREQERLIAAEKQRIDAENRRKEEDRRIAEAEAAQDQGASPAHVDAIMEQPIVTPAAPIQRPKIAGFRTPPKRFKAELIPVTGKMTLVKAVACVCGRCKCKGNPALLGLVDANMPALNSMANAQKENLNVPGVKAVPV